MTGQEILMSDETRALLGEKLVAFIQRQASKPDMILSRDDVTSDSSLGLSEDVASNRSLFRQAGFLDEGARNHAVEKIMSENFNNAAHYMPLSDLLQDVDIKGKIPDELELITPFYSESIESLINHFILGTDEQSIEVTSNINVNDVSTYFVFHEMGHIAGLYEHGADKFANSLYTQAYAEGVVNDPDVPEFVAQLRAIGTMKEIADFDYISNGSIDSNFGDITPEDFDLDARFDFFDRLNGVMNNTYHDLAESLINDQIRFKALGTIANKFMDNETFDRYQELRDNLGEVRVKDLEQFLESVSVPGELQIEYEEEIRGLAMTDALILVKDQPELMHQEILRQMVAGAYDDQPDIKQLMHNYLMGAERIAPEHFGIEAGATPYSDYLRGQGQTVTNGLNPGLRYGSGEPLQTHPTPHTDYGVH